MTHYLCHITPDSVTVARDVPADCVAEEPWVVLSEQQLQAEQARRESIPRAISARQARLWLIRHGVTLAQVDAVIATIPDAITRESVRVEWEYGTEVRRDSPFVEQLGPALGLDADAIDAAFREAAGI
jgi:hypothetical protein